MSGYYVDISEFQSEPIDWPMYKAWSSQWDNVSRVALRASYGTGYTDKLYEAHRANAEKAGIDQIIHYHYAYPQFVQNTPQNESAWHSKVIGTLRQNDLSMLDIEELVPQANSDWCLEFLQAQEKQYNRVPLIYAGQAYAEARLQDIRLARYKLVLAHWKVAELPACPLPWFKYQALQISDSATVPGFSTKVDLDMWF